MRWMFIPFVLAFILGCGGGGHQLRQVSVPETGPSQSTHLLGRVTLEEPLRFAQVQLWDEMGEIVGSSTLTDQGGNFIFPLPFPEGAVRVRVQGLAQELGREVILFAELAGRVKDRDFLHVTPLTDLVSRHRQEHGSTLQEAEEALRSFFQLPAGHTLSYALGRGPVHGGFHVPTYLSEWVQNPQLPQQIVSNALRPAELTSQSNSTPQNPPPYAPPEHSYNWNALGDQLLIGTFRGFTNLDTRGFGGPVTGVLLSGLLNLLTGTDPNESLESALSEVSKQIQAVAQEIGRMQAAVLKAIAQEELDQLQGSIVPLVSALQVPYSMLAAILDSGGDPQQLRAQAQAASGSLAQLDLVANLETLHLALAGDATANRPGMLQQFGQLNGLYGNLLRNQARTSESVSHSSQIVPLTALFQQYAAEQVKGMVLLLNQKTGIFAPDPQAVALYCEQISRNLTSQHAQVPLTVLPSDEIIVDRSSGLIWMYVVQPEAPDVLLNEIVSKFQIAGFSHWRLPTAEEMNLLYWQNGRTDGLSQAGFDLSAAYHDNKFFSVFVSGQDRVFDLNDGEVKGFLPFEGAGAPYFLVCDSGDDDATTLQVLAAAGRLTKIHIPKAEVDSNGRVQLQALGEYQLGPLASQNIDITDRVVWEVSDRQIARIVNFPAGGFKELQVSTAGIQAQAEGLQDNPGLLAFLKSGTVHFWATGRDVFTGGVVETSRDAAVTWHHPNQTLESLLLSSERSLVEDVPSHVELSLWGYQANGGLEYLADDSSVEWSIEPKSDKIEVVQSPDGSTRLHFSGPLGSNPSDNAVKVKLQAKKGDVSSNTFHFEVIGL